MSRAVAVAASRSAAASDQSTSVSAKRTTKTYTYKTDSSGNVSTEVHTHVDQSSDQVKTNQIPSKTESLDVYRLRLQNQFQNVGYTATFQ